MRNEMRSWPEHSEDGFESQTRQQAAPKMKGSPKGCLLFLAESMGEKLLQERRQTDDYHGTPKMKGS